MLQYKYWKSGANISQGFHAIEVLFFSHNSTNTISNEWSFWSQTNTLWNQAILLRKKRRINNYSSIQTNMNEWKKHILLIEFRINWMHGTIHECASSLIYYSECSDVFASIWPFYQSKWKIKQMQMHNGSFISLACLFVCLFFEFPSSKCTIFFCTWIIWESFRSTLFIYRMRQNVI